jgi:hypothetical protein
MSFFPDHVPTLKEINIQGGLYTVTSDDNGKFVVVDSNVTIPTGLEIGFNCKIFNDSANSINILTSSIITDPNSAGVSIDTNGIVEVIVVASDTLSIDGDTSVYVDYLG